MVASASQNQDRVFLGQAVYTKYGLTEYDKVTSFCARFLWKCSWRRLVKLYNQNISGNHLDVAVGTGYFLDKCRFPTNNPRIALLDLNANSLEFTKTRIERYRPTTYQANILEPIPLEVDRFDSIGLNYLFHCVPGTLATKATVVFENLKPLLKENGVLFGSTILGEGVKHNYLGKVVMEIYNSTGVFNNWQDKVSDLQDALEANFSSYSVKVVGCTAIFTARK